MKKNELISRVTEILRENDIRKQVPAIKTQLHISDDNNNSSDFKIKVPAKSTHFTVPEVADVLDALIAVVEESIKKGEDVTIYGFGSIGVKYYPERWTIHPETGERVTVAARYVPKFSFGKSLKLAVHLYNLSLEGKDVSDIDDLSDDLFDDVDEDGED